MVSKHVNADELTQIWKTLLPNDILVFYQHKFWPKKGDWREWKEQFAKACGVGEGYVRSWQGKSIADDVIFYYIRKG